MQVQRTKVNPIYQPLWKSDDWLRALLYGPRGGGRSHVAGQLALWKMTRKAGLYLFVREFQEDIDDSNFAMLKAIIKDENLDSLFDVKRTYVRCKDTQAETAFEGIRRNTESIMSKYGVVFTHVEQGERLTEEQWTILTPTITREEDCQTVVTWNQTWPTDYVEKMLSRALENPSPDTIVIRSTDKDNHYLNRRAFEAAKAEMLAESPHLYAWAYEGQYKQLSDTNPFGSKNITEAFKRERTRGEAVLIGIDVAWTVTNTSDYTALTIGDEFGNAYYRARKRVEVGKPTTDWVLSEIEDYDPEFIVVDCSEASGRLLWRDLGEKGYKARQFIFSNKTKNSLVRQTTRRMSEGNVSIDPEMMDLQNEMTLYGEAADGTFGATSGKDDLVTSWMLYLEAVRLVYGD